MNAKSVLQHNPSLLADYQNGKHSLCFDNRVRRSMPQENNLDATETATRQHT